MIKLKSLPKELCAEILDYLADYERLEGLDKVLEGEFTLLDVRRVLREISTHIRQEAEMEKGDKGTAEFPRDFLLSPQARQVLEVLSPGDEKRLLRRFGLLEE